MALEHLRRLGYYRLSGYLYPFRKMSYTQNKSKKDDNVLREDEFKPGSKFQTSVELYVFDKKLRLLVLDAIERLEVAFRVDIAYLLGAKDRFAHTNPNLLHGNFTKKINPDTGKTKHQEWLQKQTALINSSKEDFIEHHKRKYGMPLPIWVAIELWDFGMLSTFYKGMKIEDKTAIAKKYGISDCQVIESWLRCLNYVRNVAAHHCRLWNKNLVSQPKLPKKGEIPTFDLYIGQISITSRLYIALCILAHFMHYVCPRSSWCNRVKELIYSFPESLHISIQNMGFPGDWEQHAFWTEIIK